MESAKELFKNNVVVFGIVVGVAWVASAFVLAGGITQVNKKDAISVTGTALAQDQVETIKTNYAILSDCSKCISPYELAHKIGVKSLLKPEPTFVDLLKLPEYKSYISGQQLAG
jgi:hypothetical protein